MEAAIFSSPNHKAPFRAVQYLEFLQGVQLNVAQMYMYSVSWLPQCLLDDAPQIVHLVQVLHGDVTRV